MARLVEEIAVDVGLMWLALDLIYLYFANGWYDPYWAIEWFELGGLMLAVVFGFCRLLRHTRALRKP